jgi:hypothetical protein
LEQNTTIYQQKSNTTKTRLLNSLSISLGTALIVFLIKKNLIVTTVAGLGSFLFQLFEGTSKYFDGIKVTKDGVRIDKQNFMKEVETHNFKYDEIDKVIYSESKHRKPRYAIMITKDTGQQHHIFITSSIFKFAYALREMKTNGVNIELEFGDHEIELFINGQIPDVPMTNDMQITSAKNP